MQHKLSDSWKSIQDSAYLTMAEDEMDDVNCRLYHNSISNSSNSNNIVSSLLRKTKAFRNEVCQEGVVSGLEQKIQDFRADKEPRGFSKCPSPIHSDQDSPLDFSVKRRTSFSGSLTDDSQASSSSPGHMTDYSAISPSGDPGCVHENSGIIKRTTPSPDDDNDQKLFGQPRVGIPSVTLPPLLSGLDIFSGLSSNLLNNVSAMNAFSQIAAGTAKDARNKKNNRPFKAYPKEALQMPLGAFGIPSLTPAAIQQGMDLGMFAGMSNNDLVNLYQQQFQFIRDSRQARQSNTFSPSSHLLSLNGNHFLQQQNHHHNSSPPAMSSSSLSPPLITPDHPTTPGTTFQAPFVSMNSTLVSSTSSFSLGNSRKRPRSLPDEQKDAAYWERRRKNNDAAKRSRDARRAKEDEIAMRAALLEQENLKLRVEVAALKTETERLRCLLCSN